MDLATLDDFIILGYAFNIISARNVIMNNIICKISNSTNQNRSFIYSSIGGCIRSINIFFRKFENMQIIDSFSDKTTYGIIIKDDSPNIESNSYEFSNTSKVSIFSIIYS